MTLKVIFTRIEIIRNYYYYYYYYYKLLESENKD